MYRNYLEFLLISFPGSEVIENRVIHTTTLKNLPIDRREGRLDVFIHNRPDGIKQGEYMRGHCHLYWRHSEMPDDSQCGIYELIHLIGAPGNWVLHFETNRTMRDRTLVQTPQNMRTSVFVGRFRAEDREKIRQIAKTVPFDARETTTLDCRIWMVRMVKALVAHGLLEARCLQQLIERVPLPDVH